MGPSIPRSTRDPLQPGVYTPAESTTTHTIDAGLDVSGEGRSCNVIVGSFTVQELAYDPATHQITALAVISSNAAIRCRGHRLSARCA